MLYFKPAEKYISVYSTSSQSESNDSRQENTSPARYGNTPKICRY